MLASATVKVVSPDTTHKTTNSTKSMNKLIDDLNKALEEQRYEDAEIIQKKIEEMNNLYTDFFGENHKQEVEKYINSFK